MSEALKPCEFCTNEIMIPVQRAFGETKGFISSAASIYKTNDKYVLGMHEAIISGEVIINFCPMCGRDLRAENTP